MEKNFVALIEYLINIHKVVMINSVTVMYIYVILRRKNDLQYRTRGPSGA